MSIVIKSVNASHYERSLRKVFGSGGEKFSRSMLGFDKWAAPVSVLVLIGWLVFIASFEGDIGLTMHFTWLIAGGAIWSIKQYLSTRKEIKQARQRQDDFESYISDYLAEAETVTFEVEDWRMKVSYIFNDKIVSQQYPFDGLKSFQWMGDTIGICFKVINTEGERMYVNVSLFDNIDQYNKVILHIRQAMGF
jgi:predicted membrane protein